MKINYKRITNISTGFKELSNAMRGCNYIIWIEARKFEYQGNSEFTLNNLKEIFPNKTNDSKNNIDGEIYKATLNQALINIKRCLSFTAQEDGGVDITNDQLLIENRMTKFLNIIKENFNLESTTQVFQHNAYDPSYFGIYVMWGFCYIFLNEQDKTGIVIGAGAWD